MVQVQIAFVSPAFVYFPVWVAQERRMFERRNLECQVDTVGTTDGVTDALITGRCQIAVGSAEGFAAQAARTAVRMIAANANRAPLRLVSTQAISSIDGLRGAKVGTSSLGEGTATIIKTMLAAHGLTYPGDYEFVLAGAHPQRWEALQAGRIDACLQLIPYDYIAHDAGYNVIGDASTYVPEYVFSAVATDLNWATAHAETVHGFVDALSEATHWAQSHREAAADIVAAATGAGRLHSRRGLDDMLDHGVVSGDLHIDRAGLIAVFDAMRAAGTVNEAGTLSYAACVDERFLPAADLPAPDGSSDQ